MLFNKGRANYQFIYMVSLENPENQVLNVHFSLHLLKKNYHKVYQSISISEIKRVYHY